MRAIVNTAPGRLEMREWPLPEPGPGQVRVRIAACGICATILEMIAGWERTGFPAIPGHEWSGTIDAVSPGVDEAWVGTPCVADNLLPDGGEVGFEHPGGYAEFLLTEASHVHLLPPDYPLPLATLIEPLAVAVRAEGRLRGADTSSVLILGDGPLGLLILMLLRREGVERIALVGGREGRLGLARELGASPVMNYQDLDKPLVSAVMQTARQRFSITVEATGSVAGVHAAFHLVGEGGKVLVVGSYGKACADFRWNDLVVRELQLMGSNASSGAWPEAVRIALEEPSLLRRFVTHEFPAEHFAEAFQLLVNREEDAIKVVLKWL